MLGGKFTTHDYLHGKNGWIDAYFLGHKAPVFYNLTLATVRYAYKEAVWDHAWEQSYLLAPEREPDIFDRAVKDPTTGYWVTPAREPYLYPELDGLTRTQWVEHKLTAIADAKTIQVFEEWSLHRDYGHGIGLHAIIDVPFLTIDAVNAFIDRFMKLEGDYRDPVPRSYRHDEIQSWGLESNSLVDPSELKEIRYELQSAEDGKGKRRPILGALMDEMGEEIPRVEGWDEMPAVGKELPPENKK